MKKLSLLLLFLFAAPSFAQDATPAVWYPPEVTVNGKPYD